MCKFLKPIWCIHAYIYFAQLEHTQNCNFSNFLTVTALIKQALKFTSLEFESETHVASLTNLYSVSSQRHCTGYLTSSSIFDA